MTHQCVSFDPELTQLSAHASGLMPGNDYLRVRIEFTSKPIEQELLIEVGQVTKALGQALRNQGRGVPIHLAVRKHPNWPHCFVYHLYLGTRAQEALAEAAAELRRRLIERDERLTSYEARARTLARLRLIGY